MLLLHRHLDRVAVLAGITAALSVGSTRPMWWHLATHTQIRPTCARLSTYPPPAGKTERKPSGDARFRGVVRVTLGEPAHVVDRVLAGCPPSRYAFPTHSALGTGADTARRQPGHGRGREVSVLPGLLLEVVGIEDGARAMVLAAERGRVGERYIISDRFMSYKEINEIAAEAAGVRPPRIKLTLPLLYAAAHGNDLGARLLKRDLMFAAVGLRIATTMTGLDQLKAERELGWKPETVEESIRRAAIFFNQQRAGK